ncbi:oligopeptide ABC transporter substrate-binding protein [Bacillus sp. FSL W7-1360]
MKKLLKTKFFAVPALVCVLALAACGGGDSNDDKDGANKAKKEDGVYTLDDFEQTKAAEGEAIGGTLNVGIYAPSAFEGIFDWQFYENSGDSDIISWFSEALFRLDENFLMSDKGAATIDVSDDKKTYTITIKDNVNWHDGEPVKAEDYVFAHEVIGHKDYDGVRYDATFKNIVGMEEYHDGKADNISGFEIVDDKTVKVTFKEANPSLMNSGLWSYAMPKHYFEGVEVKDMAGSDQVRKKPLGYGPFKVESITPGESVTLVKNEDYWQGEPKVDKVVLKALNPNVMAESLRTGDVDMVNSFPAAQFADNADMDNVDWLGTVNNGYNYTGFKLGKWDEEKGEVVPDPEATMADVNLRKAVRLAVDYDELSKKMYNGLRFPANTVIPPTFLLYHDDSNPGFAYDPEEAKKILADAGYEDKDGDGFVETPEGEPLEITYAARAGDATAEAVAKFEMQSWRDVGLNVNLLEGTVTDPTVMYDRIQEDDPAIDMYTAGWGSSTDIDQSGLFGKDAMFNYPRYTDDRIEELLADGMSDASFDPEHRTEVYNEFQAYINEVLPIAPTLYMLDVRPVNKRVSGYSVEIGNFEYGDEMKHMIQLNDEKPAVAK